MDDDEIFESVLGKPSSSPVATAPQVAQNISSAGAQTDEEIFNSVLGGAPAPGLIKQEPQLDTRTGEPEPSSVTVKGKGTPQDPYQAIVNFSQKIQEANKVGALSFRESALGHAVKSGRMTLEEAEAQIEADDEQAQLTGDLKAYEDDVWRRGSWMAGIPTSIAIGTAKQLPMLAEVLKVGGVGAAAGFGVTAVASGGVGGSVAVPVGAMTGTAAVAGWTTDYVVGQEYLKRRREGVPHDVALATSSISGIIQGSLAGIRFGQIAKLPVDTAKNVVKAHAASMVNFLAEGVHFGGVQLALAEAQTATRLMFDAIAGTVGKAPGAIPTYEKAVAEFMETLSETLKGSAGLFFGGKAVGLTAGSVMKVFKKTHDAHMEKQAEKIQAIEEAEARSAENEQSKEQSTTEAAKSEKSKNAQEKERIKKEKAEKREAAEREINRIFEVANAILFSEHKETRMQENNRVQRTLKRMVSNSEHLDDATKVKLLKRVVEINSEADLRREGQRFIDDQRGAEFKNELKAAVTRLGKVIKSGQPKGKKGIIPAAEQQSLKWYQEFFTPPKAAKRPKGSPKRQPGELDEEIRLAAWKKADDYVQNGFDTEVKQLQENIEKLESDELAEIFNHPAKLAEKRRVAMEAAAYWNGALKPEAIHQLADQVEHVIKNGKSEFQLRKEAESTRMLQGRAEVMEGVQGVKPVTPSISKTAPKEMNLAGKVINAMRRDSTALWDKMLQDLPVEQRERLIAKYLDFTGVENEESAINHRAAEKIDSLYSKAVGSIREANRLIKDGTKNLLHEKRIVDENGNSKVVPVDYSGLDGKPKRLPRMSMNEMTYLSLAMEDPGAIPGLIGEKGNGFTLKGMVEDGRSTQEVINEILTNHENGKYLKLRDSVRDFYRWFAPLIANHYLKEYGVELPMDPNYSGQIFHKQIERLKSASDLLQDAHQFAQRSLDPGSTKLRSNSKLPVQLVDPFRQVQTHQRGMAFWIANSEKARELSFIFSDSTQDGLRDVIQHKLGKDYKSLIDGRLAFQFHLKPGIMDIADGPLQWLKGNMATGLLGARIDQAPKQWIGILHALSTNDYASFSDGLKKAADPKLLKEYVSRSEVYKERQSDLLPQILEATKERSYVDAVTGDRAFTAKQFFLIPMRKWGDGVGAAIGGFIEYNRLRNLGWSVEEAVTGADSFVERTQSSSRASRKLPVEMKGGIANLTFAFQKETTQAFNRESGAIRDWFIHRDDKHLARMARTILSIHVAQGLFQAINCLPAYLVGEEKDKDEANLRILSASLGGAYTHLPLLGIDLFHGFASGWKGTQTPRTIVGGLSGDISKLLGRTYKLMDKMAQGEDIDGEDWIREFKSVAGVASIATGLPFWGLFNYGHLGYKVTKKASEGE